MKQITNYQYDINSDGDLTIYTNVNGQTFIIATLEECVNPNGDLDNESVEMLIEEILPELDYELI